MSGATTYPGVREVHGSLQSIEAVAVRVAELAEQASRSGTFGVGGMLVTRSGDVLAEAVNAVVQDGRVSDPTAHVERQLVDWLFLDFMPRRALPLDDLMIVSSLDPCAMCAGAILRAGINVLALADDPVSGIHGGSLSPHYMPSSLWSRAERHMGLLPVDGYRQATGPTFLRPASGSVSLSTHHRACRAFASSLDTIRSLVAGDDVPYQRNLPTPNLMYAQIIEKFREALPSQVRVSRGAPLFFSDMGNCLIEDADANPIFGIASGDDGSPGNSPILDLIRCYTKLRLLLPDDIRPVFPPPRYCSILIDEFPKEDARALLDLGAIGSFMERERPPGLRPALLYAGDDGDARPQRVLETLPPLYTNIIGLSVSSVGGAG